MDRLSCRFCQSVNTNKAGKGVNNADQRYYCRSCRRTFRDNPVLQVKSAAAGDAVPPRPDLPSQSQLVLQLRAVAQSLGRTPRLRDIETLAREKRAFSRRTYLAVFGGFRAALVAARLPLATNQPVDRDDLMLEIKQLHQRLGKRLVERDMVEARRRGEVSSLAKFIRIFGSDAAAIRATGVEWARRPSRSEIIKELQNLAQSLGRVPRARDVQEAARQHRGVGYRTVIRTFGEIEAACRAAGLVQTDLTKDPARTGKSNRAVRVVYVKKPVQKSAIDSTDAAVDDIKQKDILAERKTIQSLKDLGKRLGRRPTTREIKAAGQKDASSPSAHSIALVFGSVSAALAAAGYPAFDQPRQGRRWSDGEILDSLKQLIVSLSRTPSAREVKAASKRRECVSINTITRRFGALGKALELIERDNPN